MFLVSKYPTFQHSKNLHSFVVESLGLACIQGKFGSTGLLPREDVLMKEFDVSRTVLREAIKTLASKGLLESKTKIGTRVRSRRYWNLLDPEMLNWYSQSVPSSELLSNLGEIRSKLEPLAASLAAKRRTEEDLAALRSALQEMKEATSLQHWFTADLKFHEQILFCSGNALMVPLLSIIETYLFISFQNQIQNMTDFQNALGLHVKIYEAIERQDSQAAQQAVLEILSGNENQLDQT